MRSVAEHSLVPGERVPPDVLNSPVPLILRGFVSNWPAVAAQSDSATGVADYISQFDSGSPLTVYVGDENMSGRFFYNDDLSGFNFRAGQATLAQVLARILGPAVDDDIATLYVGSTPVDQWWPGFRAANDVDLPVDGALASFWLGGQTTISAHFDYPDNLACVVAGSRRFTLFPPDQLDNLYVGPLDRTPAGQAISLVDFSAPDYQRFPKFREAQTHALVAELRAGDALFIPGMWWHHVVATERFNLLVNYWWTRGVQALGGPSLALNHAILALRNMPKRQRQVWRDLFDHYVFDSDEQEINHIPEAARGILGNLDEQTIEAGRKQLLERLKR